MMVLLPEVGELEDAVGDGGGDAEGESDDADEEGRRPKAAGDAAAALKSPAPVRRNVGVQ